MTPTFCAKSLLPWATCCLLLTPLGCGSYGWANRPDQDTKNAPQERVHVVVNTLSAQATHGLDLAWGTRHLVEALSSCSPNLLVYWVEREEIEPSHVVRCEIVEAQSVGRGVSIEARVHLECVVESLEGISGPIVAHTSHQIQQTRPLTNLFDDTQQAKMSALLKATKEVACPTSQKILTP